MSRQSHCKPYAATFVWLPRFVFALAIALNLLSGQSTYSAGKDDDLFNAVATGDMPAVQSLLKSGANVNARYHAGDTDMNTQAKDGWTPLMFAIEARQTEIAQLLLKQRVDVNAKGKYSKSTALILAAANGNFPLIELLAQKKANVRDKYAGDAIVAAIENGHYEAVRTLLKLGVKYSLLSSDGTSPLNAAVHKQQKEILKLLLQSGADPNACDKSTGYESQCPLGNAAFTGNVEIIEALIASKAKVDSTKGNENKRTALMIAASADHINAVKALLAAGAEVNYENESAYPAIVYAASPETAQLLLDNGAILSGGKAEQALRLAAVRGEISIVKFMLQSGVNVKHSDVELALVQAARYSKADVVKVLLQSGVNPNSREDGKSALLAAVELGSSTHAGNDQRIEIVRALLAAGADANAKDSTGMTPLIAVIANSGYGWCSAECVSIVKVLIEAKADVKARNMYGGTALSAAERLSEGRQKVIELLSVAGAK